MQQRLDVARKTLLSGIPRSHQHVAHETIATGPLDRRAREPRSKGRLIEAKEVNVTTERVWAEPFASVRVRYRNITKVHFRAIKVNWVERIGKERWRRYASDCVQRCFYRNTPLALRGR